MPFLFVVCIILAVVILLAARAWGDEAWIATIGEGLGVPRTQIQDMLREHRAAELLTLVQERAQRRYRFLYAKASDFIGDLAQEEEAGGPEVWGPIREKLGGVPSDHGTADSCATLEKLVSDLDYQATAGSRVEVWVDLLKGLWRLRKDLRTLERIGPRMAAKTAASAAA